jgi:AcrR family transcriptional regulator
VGNRTERPAPLSEQAIVAAALDIIAKAGVDGLTMRQLSNDLGVTLGATYKHVPNKRALLELVADELFARIEDTDPQDAAWLDRMHALFVQIFDTFRAFPGLAQHVSQHPPLDSQPPHLRTTLVKILSDGGFSDSSIDDLLNALFFYTTGALLMDATGTPFDSEAAFAKGLDFLLRGASEQRAR